LEDGFERRHLAPKFPKILPTIMLKY
jgi:hypothetical protein